MSKGISHKRRDVIAEEAADWFMRLKDADARSHTAFAAWLKTSPEHVEEFLAVAALWDALPETSAQPSIEELVALAASEENVVTLSSDGPAATPRSSVPQAPAGAGLRRWGIGLAAAATLAAAVIGGALTLRAPPVDPNLYTTAIGEQTSLPLPDGSLVTLNTQSTLRVDYSGEFRDIHLSQGEALFDVANDTERPFRVITEHAVVTAVGTQFNVRNVADDVVVTVVEGAVDVSATMPPRTPSGGVAQVPDGRLPVGHQPERLTVGQQARVASGEVAVVETAIEKVTAWKERRLVFEALSLGEVIDEFNRYNDPPLRIVDPRISEISINGVFRANDRASFVAFLEQMQLAQSDTQADGTIVLHGMDNP